MFCTWCYNTEDPSDVIVVEETATHNDALVDGEVALSYKANDQQVVDKFTKVEGGHYNIRLLEQSGAVDAVLRASETLSRIEIESSGNRDVYAIDTTTLAILSSSDSDALVNVEKPKQTVSLKIKSKKLIIEFPSDAVASSFIDAVAVVRHALLNEAQKTKLQKLLRNFSRAATHTQGYAVRVIQAAGVVSGVLRLNDKLTELTIEEDGSVHHVELASVAVKRGESAAENNIALPASSVDASFIAVIRQKDGRDVALALESKTERDDLYKCLKILIIAATNASNAANAAATKA